MKQVNLALAFLLGCSISVYGQCTVSKDNPSINSCTVKPYDENGVLNGTLTIGQNYDYTLEYSDGETELFLGALTLQVDKGATARLPDDYPLDVSASDPAGGFKLRALQEKNSAFFVYRGTSYSRPQFYDINGDGHGTGQQAVRGAAQSLPVTLTAWTAELANSGVQLKWTTALETDNDYFLLERSTDGTTFTELARVPGKGDTDGTVNYAYTDVAISAGTTFYRLSQFDYDGTRTTFDLISVSEDAVSSGGAFPNPAHAGDRITFQAPAGEREMMLQSINGSVIGRYPVSGGIDLPTNLPAGIYLIRSGEMTTRLLVRQ